MERELILIVDDDPVNLMTIRRFVERRMDLEIMEAVDGRSALDVARANPALALMLLDVQMADLSGIEVCRMLKHSPLTRSIPIILVSAVHTDDASIAEGLDAGAEGYIAKPVDENMLHAWLKATMRINALNRALAEQGGQVPADMAALLAEFARLSHNVNNPLQAIMASADLLAMEFEDNPGVKETVQVLQENADQIARLVGEASQQAKVFKSRQGGR